MTPEWPPTTGTSTNFMSSSLSWLTNVLLRTQSSVVTPMTFCLLYEPAFCNSNPIGQRSAFALFHTCLRCQV